MRSAGPCGDARAALSAQEAGWIARQGEGGPAARLQYWSGPFRLCCDAARVTKTSETPVARLGADAAENVRRRASYRRKCDWQQTVSDTPRKVAAGTSTPPATTGTSLHLKPINKNVHLWPTHTSLCVKFLLKIREKHEAAR